jgi:hypothetical protein
MVVFGPRWGPLVDNTTAIYTQIVDRRVAFRCHRRLSELLTGDATLEALANQGLTSRSASVWPIGLGQCGTGRSARRGLAFDRRLCRP